MRFLNKNIKHVIYVVKENRTFDQVLGDLTNGAKVDPSLVQFGQALTPNYHKLATEFVTLDNFMNPGDGSMDGWSWTLQGRVTKTETITQQINYAAVNRGLSYESEGSNRGVPVNWATVAQRDAAQGPAGHDQLQHALGDPAWRHGEPVDRSAQPRVDRRAVRHGGRLHLQRGAERRQDRPQLRLPREQHRQHRHDRGAREGSVRRPGSSRWRRSIRRWRRSPTSTSAATTRSTRTCGATTSGSVSSISSSPTARCPTCRWCASATTTWATSAPRWAASTRRKRSRPSATSRLV